MLLPGAKALWPDTLPRFWGLHALGWSAAGVGLAGLVRFTPVPCSVPPALLCAGAAALAGANLALSTLLYRTDEEAGASLAGAAARDSVVVLGARQASTRAEA